jgi:hypothetical protein
LTTELQEQTLIKQQRWALQPRRMKMPQSSIHSPDPKAVARQKVRMMMTTLLSQLIL